MEKRIEVLSAVGIRRSFSVDGRKIDVLCGIDISLKPGEIVGITGASGTGKSTLLHILGGLDRPDRGSVFIEGQDFFGLNDERRSGIRGRKIGFVFQFHYLLSEFSALENALIPARIAGAKTDVARKKAEELFEMVGLSERLGHRPGKLSGGEQQRAALVRALINDPKILLADEPTGNLDENTADEVFSLLRKIAAKKNLATVIVTHNLKLARQMDTVYQLHEGVLEKKEMP